MGGLQVQMIEKILVAFLAITLFDKGGQWFISRKTIVFQCSSVLGGGGGGKPADS